MYKASIYNSNAGTLELNGHEERYQVISITGLNPPQAQINTTDPAGIDGVLFNSSRLLMRNIVIMLRINGDVEANRLDLYRYFAPGDKVRFTYENNRSVYIDGYIDTVECEIFSMSEVMQISIICPEPYFLSMEDTEATWAGNVFTCVNDSDIDTGFVLSFTLKANHYPSRIILQKIDAGEALMLIGSFKPGDRFIIDTNEDSVGAVLIRNGVEINALEYMVQGSVFSTLQAASTARFRLQVLSGSILLTPDDMTATFRMKYRGV